VVVVVVEEVISLSIFDWLIYRLIDFWISIEGGGIDYGGLVNQLIGGGSGGGGGGGQPQGLKPMHKFHKVDEWSNMKLFILGGGNAAATAAMKGLIDEITSGKSE